MRPIIKRFYEDYYDLREKIIEESGLGLSFANDLLEKLMVYYFLKGSFSDIFPNTNAINFERKHVKHIYDLIFGIPDPRYGEISLPVNLVKNIANILNSYTWRNEFTERNDAVLTPRVFSHVYQSSLQDRKVSGSFYTPQLISDYIAERCIEREAVKRVNHEFSKTFSTIEEIIKRKDHEELSFLFSKVLLKLRILDPAMGSGFFLISALSKLVNWCTQCANLLKSRMFSKMQDHFISLEGPLIHYFISNSLYGTDLQSNAIRLCKIQVWMYYLRYFKARSFLNNESLRPTLDFKWNFREGNSLIGDIAQNDKFSSFLSQERVSELKAFDWWQEFPGVMKDGGFDIIIGNPPYGDRVLSLEEKALIEQFYLHETSKIEGQKGSKNAAAIFIERAHGLLKNHGKLGLIIPNSVARSREFSKIRDFLLDEFKIWEIVDEGSPFKGVTLEMISVFSEKMKSNQEYEILVKSRRENLSTKEKTVRKSIFKKYNRFMLYWDEFWEKVADGARLNVIKGKRGMVPGDKVTKQRDNSFYLPVLFSGKTVKKYLLIPSEFKWGSEALLQSPTIREARDEEMLLATRLDNYIRAAFKPPGYIPGDNVIKLTLNDPNFTLKEVLLILNSKLFGYIVPRYLFNNAGKTSWLQSITHLLPIKASTNRLLFEYISDLLLYLNQHYYDSFLSQGRSDEGIEKLIIFYEENIGDTLVYELYLSPDPVKKLALELGQIPKPEKMNLEELEQLQKTLNQDSRIQNLIYQVRDLDFVKIIEGDSRVRIIENKKRAFNR